MIEMLKQLNRWKEKMLRKSMESKNQESMQIEVNEIPISFLRVYFSLRSWGEDYGRLSFLEFFPLYLEDISGPGLLLHFGRKTIRPPQCSLQRPVPKLVQL